MVTSSTQTNYIRHLNAFFAQVWKDDRLRTHHISLYMALFQVWNHNRFQHPFPVLREEVMILSRIGSRNTYVKCMKELQQYQYITYRPAKHPYAPSLVTMMPLADFISGSATEQLPLFSSSTWPKSEPHDQYKNEPHTWLKNGTRSGSKVGHIYNKHINNIKRERENILPPPKKNIKNEAKKDQPGTDAPRAENTGSATRNLPALSQVQEFFNAAGYPKTEADKFFHHYQANGWLQGGKTPIADWQAAAHKWALNIHPLKTQNNDQYTQSPAKPGRLHTNENKSYADPL
ncbi:MAG TPA: hypothetical protein VM802_30340 [Chitinophaga sp.]|uniref:hypothetical protein n=1 Tax=Chitinophaga sp. TaxID=1869181 RepID=UPI002C3CC0EC|nr:hypothetical protein [Chitinophaga sp.]HVI49206.1 hypothetical protein [Chitinophaga sp.]